MPILCNFLNCKNRASYGLVYGVPLRCKGHKEEYKPQYAVCRCGKAQPVFNEPGETKSICCASCKTATMENVRAKTCRCGKARPRYNEPGETKAIWCASCKTATMLNVVSKKCLCGKVIPVYNEPGETNAICCVSCKTATMENIVSKKCLCGKARPSYNEPGETKAICCASCKTATMENIVSKKCLCGKAIPIYNEPGETKTICCASCKTATMKDVNSKKCLCGKAQPVFNEPGETNGICCSLCKTATMKDVINIKCKGFNNESCPYKRSGNTKYKNYCTECFRRAFPLDPMTFQIRSKTKEIAVRDFLNSVFDGFHHDACLYTSHCDCSVRRRIDHRKCIGNTLLVIETDENQHKSYDKMDEETRYDDLYMAFSGKWIYIRFNPDKYTNRNGKSKNPMIANRLEALKEEIEKQIARIEREENMDLVERVYMYYDGYD